jgi:hypothetical protein
MTSRSSAWRIRVAVAAIVSSLYLGPWRAPAPRTSMDGSY